ncbi:MAG: FkbM family methyltransferase [Butyricicoccus pullicaecorum]
MWERLQREDRPIALYGMGDGADKILRVFADKGIKASTVFASDEFVRGHSFAGFRVQKLSEVVEQYGEDIVIVLSFASQRPELLERFYELNARFDLVAPDVPVAGGGLFDLDFVRAYADEFQRAYDWMADETARQVFSDIVNFKISGKIDYLRHCETDKDEVFRNILKPHGRECFADLGAYNGDTIRELLSYTDGAYDSITALEPDKRNFKKLSRYAEESLTGKVELVQAGGWSEDTVLTFAAKAGRNSALAKQGIPTQMRSLDSVLGGAPCTMLKLDVEGAERQALLGAQRPQDPSSPSECRLLSPQ